MSEQQQQQQQEPVGTAAEQSENNNDRLVENKNYCASSKLRINCRRESGDSDNPRVESDADPDADSGRPSSVDTDPRSPCATTAAAENTEAKKASSKQAPPPVSAVRGASPVPGDENDVIHQFLIPNRLGGSMVGTRGRNINYIRAKSGASVWISRNFFDKKTQVVNVRGPVECVKCALQVIKKRFPELDVKPINTAVPIHRNPALQPTMCQLNLPVAVHVDVLVTAACRGTTIFLQQPSHPTYQQLAKMDGAVRRHYACGEQSPSAVVPSLPRPVNPGAVCVAPSGGNGSEGVWHRSIIADVFPETDSVLMKFLDWGGYEQMPVSYLRQIRTELMHLPFQAVEGHLAYVTPLLRPDQDAETQLESLSGLIQRRYLAGRRLKCQVVYFNHIGQPCVYLYSREPAAPHWRCVQEDLVQAGLATWFCMPRIPPQLPSPVA